LVILAVVEETLVALLADLSVVGIVVVGAITIVLTTVVATAMVAVIAGANPATIESYVSVSGRMLSVVQQR
jgi:hypothetical protein